MTGVAYTGSLREVSTSSMRPYSLASSAERRNFSRSNVLADLLGSAVGVLSQDLLHPGADPADLISLDGQIGRGPLRAAYRRLVDQHTRIGQSKRLPGVPAPSSMAAAKAA